MRTSKKPLRKAASLRRLTWRERWNRLLQPRDGVLRSAHRAMAEIGVRPTEYQLEHSRLPKVGCVLILTAPRVFSAGSSQKCGSISDAWKTAQPRTWACRACQKQFSVTAGTPMERTHLPLPTWFMAIYLIASSSKGVSAMVISRQLGISYKTAWFLSHRIRQLLADDDSTLKGIVEVDETDIGGKRRREAKIKSDSDDDQPKGR